MEPGGALDAYPVNELRARTNDAATTPKSTSMKPAIKFTIKQQTGDAKERLRFFMHLFAFIVLPLACFAYTFWRACSSDEKIRETVAMSPSRANLLALSTFWRASSISWVAHRLLAHRSFHPVRPFKFLLLPGILRVQKVAQNSS